MNPSAPRVVYDCNIFAQNLINLNGPAGRCVRLAREASVSLFASAFVLMEIRELYAKLPPKYGVTREQTDELSLSVASFATLASDITEIYRHPIDASDSHYVNLAIKADARIIVSRDRHLLNLMDISRSEGRDFQSRFPLIRVIDPVVLLAELQNAPA
jgi:putative PIN family toxin of toxin-antitoxin system